VRLKSTTDPFSANVRVPKLVTIVTRPLFEPTAVAVNDTVIVQVVLLGSVPQLFVCAYAPLTLTLFTFKVVPDKLKNVSDCGTDCVFTTWLKVSGPGSNNSGSCPVPLKLIVCGLPAPDEVIVIAPVRVPIALGVKITVTVHVAFCANVVGHEFVRLKSPVAADIDMPVIEPLLAVSVTDCPLLAMLNA
jgi:hypothetical protein